MKKTYTYNDIMWYLNEVGANDSNYQPELFECALNSKLPQNWQNNLKITTNICNLMQMFMCVNPKASWISLKDFTVNSVIALYNPICVEL